MSAGTITRRDAEAIAIVALAGGSVRAGVHTRVGRREVEARGRAGALLAVLPATLDARTGLKRTTIAIRGAVRRLRTSWHALAVV